MNGYNSFDFNNSAFLKAIEQVQRTIDAVNVPMDGMTAALEEYQRCVAPLTVHIEKMNALSEPLLALTRQIEKIDINPIKNVLQNSADIMRVVSSLDISGMTAIASSVAEALPDYDELLKNVSVEEIFEHYKNGEITDEDIVEEVQEIMDSPSEKLTILERWDAFKKSKRFIAILIVFKILCFVGQPVIERIEDNTREVLGINQFWEESGIYEWIDDLFVIENGTVSEQEAKETVDDTKIGNISKQKREDLLSKIKEIRTFISAAPQDENTGNLLSYLSDLEKDVNGKKYGLIFEEHCEKIDEVLYNHTPVLSEYSELFIDNGGEMNFLVEGDNLASLQLLKKTHKGRIDVIYIDPPYNTLKEGFTYSDTLIDKNDTFRHSKWLSFMQQRLLIAKELLSDNGVIFVSLDDNEIAALRILCDEIFGIKIL